ncbi:MAG: NAD(P)H-dependent oxidoreductase [Deltaproteobacteria bacterium]
MNILIVKAHPLENSLCALFTEKAIHALERIGHDIILEDLYQNQFDAALTVEERRSYYSAAYDSSSVSGEIERLVNADALVLIFPTWWFGFPAILKGWFDRVWVPTVAYSHANDYGPIKPRLRRLKKTFVLTTLGGPWWLDYLILRRPVKRILRFALLGACARKSKLKFLSFYKCESVKPERVDTQIRRIEAELNKFFGES